MIVEGKPENEPDDEQSRRDAAEELQKQIDALVRGDIRELPDKPRSLREFIERSGGNPSNKPKLRQGESPDEESPRQAIDSDAAAGDAEKEI